MKKKKLISQQSEVPKLTTLANESDRGCVILASAILDHHLTRIHEAFITAHLTGILHPKDFFESLTTQFGPLATFSGKIKLAFAYGLIYKEEYTVLEIVRKLRNEAAHETIIFNFDDKGVKQLVTALEPFNDKNAADLVITKAKFPALSEIKMTFIRSCYGLRMSLEDRYIDGVEEILKKREIPTS